ncbi:hypothetical protein [Bombilactobacillus bombi]|uniref:hypothetical protein n=1 Tax=Bombilactobacillus bombi TaxID=1303590 RepID=UPI0015E5DC9D|nr:hypothetical protein [Bombilactobacillus bombi]MBA1434289.1 hypothetical protein [Bombilactobacillus bombi]
MALQTKNAYLVTSRQTSSTVLKRITRLVNAKLMDDTPITTKQLLVILAVSPVIWVTCILATAAILLL